MGGTGMFVFGDLMGLGREGISPSSGGHIAK